MAAVDGCVTVSLLIECEDGIGAILLDTREEDNSEAVSAVTSTVVDACES